MGARILVIEDDAAALELMTYLLRAFGHVVHAAGNGVEGIETVLREAPDLVVCDMQLPRMDGAGVMTELKLKRRLRNLPVIAVTAYAMVGDRDKILAMGFDGYIAKPIDPEMFVRQLNAFLPPDKRAATSPLGAADTAPAAISPPPLAERGAILLVDDSPANLDVLTSTLAPLGYRVIAARTILEALARVRATPPDVVLSDLHMPKGGGLDLVRVLKTEPALRAIPVVVISASDPSPQECAKIMAEGAVKVIVRPIEPRALLAAIEASLEESRYAKAASAAVSGSAS